MKETDKNKSSKLLCLLLVLILAGAPADLLAQETPAGGSTTAPPTRAEDDKSKPIPPAKEPEKPATITNLWVETDLRAVFQDMSAQTKVQILVGPSVQGVVSMEAKEMPLEECLKRLCCANGYALKKIRDYYVVGSCDPGSPLASLLFDTERIDLSYAKVTTVRSLLPKQLVAYVQMDKETNTLLVSAPKRILDKIRGLIEKIDIPAKQVVVEALVVELSEKGSKELGTDLKWSEFGSEVSSAGLVLAGSVLRDGTGEKARLGVTLKALVTKEQAKVLANPRLTALDGQQASIYVGHDKYYSMLSGHADNPYYRLESIKAGVTLKLTPHIGNNGQITLELAPEVSNVNVAAGGGGNGNNLPVITRRTANTTVRIQSGHTIIIGGLLSEEVHRVECKVPILGHIPLLGLLFRWVKIHRERKEVVIFITPRLLSDSDHGKTAESLSREIVEPIQLLKLEERINEMAKDVEGGNIDGIRARLRDFRSRLRKR